MVEIKSNLPICSRSATRVSLRKKPKLDSFGAALCLQVIIPLSSTRPLVIVSARLSHRDSDSALRNLNR